MNSGTRIHQYWPTCKTTLKKPFGWFCEQFLLFKDPFWTRKTKSYECFFSLIWQPKMKKNQWNYQHKSIEKVGCLVGCLVDCLVGCLVGWLVGWLIRSFVRSFLLMSNLVRLIYPEISTTVKISNYMCFTIYISTNIWILQTHNHLQNQCFKKNYFNEVQNHS